MSSDQIDINRLRRWIGREEVVEDRLGGELVRRFNATFDEEPGDARPGDVAPRLIHHCLGQPAAPTGSLGDDGHPQRGGFLPPVPLPRRMWAGGSVEFHGDLRVGDLVRRTSRIEDVSVKEGRSGVLCFVAVDHVFDVEGRPMVKERQDIVYRSTEPTGANIKPSAPDVPKPAGIGSERKRIQPSPTLLFRYSAITFNGHRIHYDAPYAQAVEGYPGLVVHGPMQATMLLRFAAEIRGTEPQRFQFRSQSPLFDNADFFLNAENDGDRLRLWTAVEAGSVAMAAEASWA